MDGNVLGQQLIGKDFELRPECQCPLQVRRTQRVLFDADEVQARTGHGLLLEQLPGAKKIQPGAEPGLADHQPTIGWQLGKALTEAVLLDEHVAGFIKARLIGEIHVVKHSRTRATLVVPVKLGVGHNRLHGRLRGGKAAILADHGNGD
ncbi:hypothetical protein D3C78_760380 [compost metagenome]